VRHARRALVGLCVTVALTGATSASAAAPAMKLGFTDLSGLQSGLDAERPLDLEHLKATRATSARIMWKWRDVEKVKPPDDAAAQDPAYAGYDFTALDALLRDTQAAGVEPLLMFYYSPDWWEGPGRPAISDDFPRGTWKPDPAAYGRFLSAAARRYSGTFADPQHPGQALPRVKLWQIWNEPNLYTYLTPQWTESGGHFRATSPGFYKQLLSAGYDGVKSVAADNTVITAGTAPFGDVPKTALARIQPARFVRDLLCVDGRARPKARNCRSKPAKFDVLAHHPYPIGPPGRHAINADDVVIPDFAKLTAPLKIALKAGNVFPRAKSKPVWCTEMSWDSNPPDPGGIPVVQQARYAAGAIYVLWRQGVTALYWFNLRDDPKGRGYQYGLQSGVYYRGDTVAQDTPKPAVQAYRFPFVAYRAYSNFKGHGTAKLWGMAPAPGSVQIQKLSGSTWKTVATARARSNHVFELRVSAGRGVRLRAFQAGEASIDAKVF
jgi:hypothetical protein